MSRGASKCLFVERSRESAEITQANINTCGFGDRTSLKITDAVSFLKTCPYKFDIAILDPPYDSNLLAQTLPLLSKLLSENGVVIAEHNASFIPEDLYGEDLRLVKQYKYGTIVLSKFARITESGEDEL
jgi:16S rRNA G966 N2-methylase RsmD